MSIADYVRLYSQQYEEFIKSQDQESMRLLESPDRTVWTTWWISVYAVSLKRIDAVNLLFLWACLDNSDLWYGLFATSYERYKEVATELPPWLRRLGRSEVCFISAMRILCNYSLVESVQGLASYATHLTVHKWAFHVQDKGKRALSNRLAVWLVAAAVPRQQQRDFLPLQFRLSPHVQRCWEWVTR